MSFRLPPLVLLALLPLPLLAQSVKLTADASRVVRTIDDRLYGVNIVMWDSLQSAPETAPLVRALQFGALRIPGGSLSDDYDWQTNKRVSDKPNWTWTVNIAQHAQFVEGQGAEAYVTVNYGSGTPEQAAAWVAYYNGSASDARALGKDAKNREWNTVGFWAALRGASPLGTDDGYNFLRIAHPAPFGFRYWEVGNEVYGTTWEYDEHGVAGSGLLGVKNDPYTYAGEYQRFVAAMKAVDPSIRIGAVGTFAENEWGIGTNRVTNPRTGQSYTGWMPVMLARLKVLGVTPDFLIDHYYAQNPGQESDATLLQRPADLAGYAKTVRQILKDYLGDTEAAKVELVMTELNSVSSKPGKQSANLVNALFYADAYGTMAETEYNACLWWDLHNGVETSNNNSAALYGWRMFGCYDLVAGKDFTGVPMHTPLPTYYGAKLMTHWGRGGDQTVAATSDSTLLSCHAARLADGRLALLVVNKNPTADLTAQISLQNFIPGSGTATVWSYGKTNDAQNSANPDLTASTITNASASFTYTFPSYSATVIQLAAPVAVPVISTQPASQVVAPGGSVTLSVTASGEGPLSYQWYKDGAALAGQTGPSLTLANAQASDAGNYTVVVTNALGTATSSTATVTVATASQLGRLSNLSARAVAGKDSRTLIIGLIISGTGGQKELLGRAVGPTLAGAPYNVPGTLADPSVTLFTESGTLITSNDNWGGTAALTDLVARTGAFAFASPTSKDAALGLNLGQGAYTVHVNTSAESSGVALAEFYDATTTYTEDTPRLMNLSARAQVGTDADVLIVGFVLGGSTPRKVLIRAVGPTLATSPYNVGGVLANPKMELYRSPENTLLQTNDDWGSSPDLAEIKSAMTAVHAFALVDGSKDAAIIATLAPGGYTAVISGVNRTTGVALGEVYLVP